MDGDVLCVVNKLLLYIHHIGSVGHKLACDVVLKILTRQDDRHNLHLDIMAIPCTIRHRSRDGKVVL